MELMVLLFLVAFAVGIGKWATAWGRNGWGWGIAALIISPLLTGIVLLIAGKTVEAKAEEARKIKDLVG